LFSEHSLRLFVGLFLGVWIARYLGPNDYGKFNYIISFVTLFYPLFSFGADDVTVQRFSENPERDGTVLGSSLVLKLGSSVFAVAFIYILGSYLIQKSPELESDLIGMLLLYGLCFGTRFADVFYNLLQSRFRETTAVKIRNTVFILTSIAKVAGVLLKMPWTFFILLSGLEIVFVSIALVLVGVRIELKNPFSVSREMIKSISSVSIFLMFVILFEQGLSRVDQIMVGNILGTEKLGVYSAAAKLINLWIFIPTSIGIGLFPLLVKSFKENKENYDTYLEYLYGLLFWLALVFSIGTSVLSEFIIKILYGAKYIGAGKILMILCWQSVFMFYSFGRNKVFTIEGLQKKAFVVMGLTFLLNLPLNYIFINKMGIEGAAWASILAYIAGIILMSIFSSEVRHSFIVFLGSVSRPVKIYKGLKKELYGKS